MRTAQVLVPLTNCQKIPIKGPNQEEEEEEEEAIIIHLTYVCALDIVL